MLPIAGLIAFYNEKVDLFLDGVQLERPRTHFSKRWPTLTGLAYFARPSTGLSTSPV